MNPLLLLHQILPQPAKPLPLELWIPPKPCSHSFTKHLWQDQRFSRTTISPSPLPAAPGSINTRLQGFNSFINLLHKSFRPLEPGNYLPQKPCASLTAKQLWRLHARTQFRVPNESVHRRGKGQWASLIAIQRQSESRTAVYLEALLDLEGSSLKIPLLWFRSFSVFCLLPVS